MINVNDLHPEQLIWILDRLNFTYFPAEVRSVDENNHCIIFADRAPYYYKYSIIPDFYPTQEEAMRAYKEISNQVIDYYMSSITTERELIEFLLACPKDLSQDGAINMDIAAYRKYDEFYAKGDNTDERTDN